MRARLRRTDRATLSLLFACFNAVAIPVLFWQQANLRSERVTATRALVRESCRADDRQNRVLRGLVVAAVDPNAPRNGPANPRFQSEARRALNALRPLDCRVSLR